MRARASNTRASKARWVSAALTAVAVVLAGAVSAHAATYVYVTSARDNQVSQFGVGSGGMLSPLTPPGATVSRPTSGVAVSPNGRWVYVTTGAGLAQFDLAQGGLLTPMTPAAVPVLGAVSVVASPDRHSVYVLSEQGAISQFSVGADGTLSPKSPASVLLSPPLPAALSALAVSPDGRSVYAVNSGTAANNSNLIYQFDVGTNGTLSPKSPATVTAGERPSGVAVSPDGHTVYVTNSASDTVSEFGVSATGALTLEGAVGTGDAPAGLAISPDGGSLYVTNFGDLVAGGGSVSQYDVAPDGTLSPKQPFSVPAGRNPEGVGVSPDGSSVYVTDHGPVSGGGALYQFDVQEDGTLTPKSPASLSAGNNPAGLAVSPAFARAVNDVLTGSPGSDVMYGHQGNDVIRGAGGNDLLYGGPGNDRIDGGPGNDVLYGGPGNDVLYGGPGNDVLYGGPGNDVLYGGPGNDQIVDHQGATTVFPGSGDNRVDVADGRGDDRVVCAPGSINHIVADPGDRIARSCRGRHSTIRYIPMDVPLEQQHPWGRRP
jgi:DNA-binding beta-propeller fold protein YncE